MLVEVIPKEPLSFSVFHYKNPKLQHTVQVTAGPSPHLGGCPPLPRGCPRPPGGPSPPLGGVPSPPRGALAFLPGSR